MIKFKTGEYDIIFSGSFIVSDKEFCSIEFIHNRKNFIIELRFIDQQEKLKFSGKAVNDDINILFEVPRSINSLGSGLTAPIRFVTLENGKSLYIYLWNRKLSDPHVEVSYTIYEGKLS